jgi:hypothetical protein
MISSHLPSFPRQSFADKLRPAQNPWFASCGTSIHTSQSMQTMQTWDSTWTPTMCEVLDFVRLVSVLLRKNLFLRTLNPSSSYIQKTSSFCHKEFHGMRLNWHFIIFIIFSSSTIWDDLRSEMSWPQELKDFRQVSNGDAVARPQCCQTQQCQTAPLVVSFRFVWGCHTAGWKTLPLA